MYDVCIKLQAEVAWRLRDERSFREECQRHFREVCRNSGQQSLTKRQWREMTYGYIQRVVCGTAYRRERIFRAADSFCPDSKPISEDVFVKLTRYVLNIANDDLCERLTALHGKLQRPLAKKATTLKTAPIAQMPYVLASAPTPVADMLPLQHRVHSGMPVRQLPPQTLTVSALAPDAPTPAAMLHDAPLMYAPHAPSALEHASWERSYDPSPALIPRASLPELHPRGAVLPALVPSAATRDVTANYFREQEKLRALLREQAEFYAPHAPESARQLQADHLAVRGVGEQRGLGIHPAGDGIMTPPCLGGSVALTLRSNDDAVDEVERMKDDILNGALCIEVFNKTKSTETKRLAINRNTESIVLLRDDGLCDGSWAISSLRCIVRGIDTAILEEPPPQDCAAAFRFRLSDSGNSPREEEEDDLFLCVLFDTAAECALATRAFCELCQVQVVASR